MNDAARKLGRAYLLGFAFAKGLTCRLAQDGDDDESEDVKFRTLDNGAVIAIKDDEIVGGAGSSVGTDKLPTFEFFASAEERKGQSFTKTVRQYAEQHLKPVVEALRYPKGMPPDCERIAMGTKQIRELASHMNGDKAKVLPYIADVYRRGTFRGERDEKHPNDFASVIYTTANVSIDGETYRVELVSKKRSIPLKSEGTPYLQYGISKADTVEDGKPRSCYEFLEVRLS